MANDFKINKQAIRRMSRELEKEFAKNPVRVPVHADPTYPVVSTAATVNNYHGPVVTVNGDHAQIVWGSENVSQTQARSEEIAPGYEDLARLITDLLPNLASYNLTEDEADEATTSANMLLSEVVKKEPDRRLIGRGITILKGLFAPIAAGVSQAATEESAKAARDVIEALGSIQF